jgi:hypothetical protein
MKINLGIVPIIIVVRQIDSMTIVAGEIDSMS